MIYDILIVGAGPAGLTAAIYGCRAGRSVLLLEGGIPGGQAATSAEVENWPGTRRIFGAEFATSLVAQAEDLGAVLQYDSVVSAAAGEDGVKRVTGSSGAVYEGKTLILANGVKRRSLGVPGEEKYRGRGVSYCATCDGAFFRGRETAVVGGGSAALEDALYLSTLCNKVHLIHRRDSFRGEARLAQKVQETPNIVLHLKWNVTEIMGDQSVIGVKLTDGSREKFLPCSGMFLAIGLIPDNQPFENLFSLTEGGYFDVDETLHAKVPGVFAAGDCRRKALRQLVTAASDGAVAAYEAEGYLSALS